MQVHTLTDALATYWNECGDDAPIPAGDAEYDDERGGWLLENINGPLALVHDDGTVTYPVHDAASGEWVIPE